MSDVLGTITVPNYDSASSTFPLPTRLPWSYSIGDEIAVHTFGDVDAKIEQRFKLGSGVSKFVIGLAQISNAERASLKSFWTALGGPLNAFYYAAPNDDLSQTTTTYVVRFENAALTWDQFTDGIVSGGVTVIGVPASAPTYSVSATYVRYPDSGFAASLLSQTQEMVPMMVITAKDGSYPVMHISDRRATIGGQLYLPRLLDWDGIAQTLGPADDAVFNLGNADGVMTQVAAATNLQRADVQFSLYHVNSANVLNLWRGEVKTFSDDEGPIFKLTCSDGIYELTLNYPPRTIDRQCWKVFNDGAACPAATAGGTNLGVACDKGFDTANGCQYHNMSQYFGGIISDPQGVNIKDTGSSGHPLITATSIVQDSMYGLPLPQIFTDIDMPVNCIIAAGRDESAFYNALGIIGEGPIGQMSANANQTLDGQPYHSPFAPIVSLGADPNAQKFGLDQGGTIPTAYTAAGTAFMLIRRTDAPGIQPSAPSSHSMIATVNKGLSGFVWTAPGSRSTAVLTNPVWIAVNAHLRAKGLQFSSAAVQEQYFGCADAVAAAAICDTVVASLTVGQTFINPPIEGTNTGLGNYTAGVPNEKQFTFRGIIAAQQPLRDWLDQILLNCLGQYSMAFGKLKLSIRENASAVEAFTAGNIIFQSVQLSAFEPAFNRLKAVFADAQYSFAQNTATYYDIDNAKLIGATFPRYEDGQVNLAGTTSGSQAQRVVVTRTREEIGGINATEWQTARNLAFNTTVLALNTEPGMVISATHSKVPTGSGKFRIIGWKLNKDYSISITGRTVTDSMYDLTVGPKPADVIPSPIPIAETSLPALPAWLPYDLNPPASDPLFAQGDYTFGISDAYQTLADGTGSAQIAVTGVLPLTNFFNGARPNIRLASVQTTGGTIAGGQDVYVCLEAMDTTGLLFTARSNVIRVPIPAGTNTNQITLDQITYPVGSVGVLVFASPDPNLICWQTGNTSAIPATIVLTALPNRASFGPDPDQPNVRIRVKAKQASALGVAFGTVVTVLANQIYIPAGTIQANGDFVGHVVSIVSRAAGGALGILNFTITGSTLSTGLLQVSPDPVAAGVGVNDVWVIRTAPSTHTSATIGDAKWLNGQAPTGLVANQDAGQMIRIIAGTGRGQSRICVSNTATVHTVTPAWDTTPDATSVYIVEDPSWLYQADSPIVNSTSPTANVGTTTVRVDNLANKPLVVIGVLATDFGLESGESAAVVRDIYVKGTSGSLNTNRPPDVPTLSATASLINGGRQTQITATITLPTSLTSFDRVEFWLYKGTTVVSTAIIDEGTWFYDPLNPTALSFIFTENAPDSTETWTLFATSGDAIVQNKLDIAHSPTCTVSVGGAAFGSTGVEYAPLILSPALAGLVPDPTYRLNDDGSYSWQIAFTWSYDTGSSHFKNQAGVTIQIFDGVGNPIWAYLDTSQTSISSPWWPVQAGSTTLTFAFLSVGFDNNGKTKTNTYVVGVTPSVAVTIAQPTATTGIERAPVVTGVGATAFTYKDSNGVTSVGIDVSWTPPSDARFGGVSVYRVGTLVSTSTLTLLHRFYLSPGRIFDLTQPSASDPWTLYFVSFDKQGRENTIYGGVTPTAVVTVGSTTGTLDLSLAASASFSAQFQIVSGVFKAVAIDAATIVTGQLQIGGGTYSGGGAKPSLMKVFDTFGNLVAFVGDANTLTPTSYPFVGGWFKTLKVGGTDPTNAPLSSDTSGNVTLLNGSIYVQDTLAVGGYYTTATLVPTHGSGIQLQLASVTAPGSSPALSTLPNATLNVSGLDVNDGGGASSNDAFLGPTQLILTNNVRGVSLGFNGDDRGGLQWKKFSLYSGTLQPWLNVSDLYLSNLGTGATFHIQAGSGLYDIPSGGASGTGTLVLDITSGQVWLNADAKNGGNGLRFGQNGIVRKGNVAAAHYSLLVLEQNLPSASSSQVVHVMWDIPAGGANCIVYQNGTPLTGTVNAPGIGATGANAGPGTHFELKTTPGGVLMAETYLQYAAGGQQLLNVDSSAGWWQSTAYSGTLKGNYTGVWTINDLASDLQWLINALLAHGILRT